MAFCLRRQAIPLAECRTRLVDFDDLRYEKRLFMAVPLFSSRRAELARPRLSAVCQAINVCNTILAVIDARRVKASRSVDGVARREANSLLTHTLINAIIVFFGSIRRSCLVIYT